MYLLFHAERGHIAENDFSMKIKSNCWFLQSPFSEHKLFSVDIHSIYIWKSSPIYSFLRTFSWKFVFTARVFAWNPLRGSGRKIIFSYFSLLDMPDLELKPCPHVQWANILLDYGDFHHSSRNEKIFFKISFQFMCKLEPNGQ